MKYKQQYHWNSDHMNAILINNSTNGMHTRKITENAILINNGTRGDTFHRI